MGAVYEDKTALVYAARYGHDRRAVVKGGVGFFSAMRNIEECIIRAAGREDVRMEVKEGELQVIS